MGRKTYAVVVAAVALVLGALAAPAAGGGFCAGYEGEKPTAGKGTAVAMSRNCFAPTVLYVEPGDRVVFTNKDTEAHTVGGAAGSFGDMHREIGSGGRVSYAFRAEGVYPYVCLVHPGMAGAIVVGDGVGNAGDPPTSTGGGEPVASEAVAASSEGPADEGALSPATGLAIVTFAVGALLVRARAARRRRASGRADGA